MKNKRQQAITDIIQKNQICTQEELVCKLTEQGFEVTQATVSRDIRQMNLKKEASSGEKSHYVMPVVNESLASRYGRVLREGVINIDVAMNLLVLRTQPGMAMAVAAALDSFRYKEIVGTIAGDDTVMVAIRTPNDARIVQKRIETLLSE